MGSSKSSADYIVGQLARAGNVSARKMFGEYGVYCDGRMVAIIVDDLFYVRITAPGLAIAGDLEQVSPFPQAKPYFHVPGDRLEDDEWLAKLIRVTAPEIPLPKPKRARKEAPESKRALKEGPDSKRARKPAAESKGARKPKAAVSRRR